AVLQQQDTAIHRVALYPRASNIQSRLVQTAEKLLHDNPGLVVQGIVQRGQAAFLLRLDQVCAARDRVQARLFGGRAWLQGRALCVRVDGDGGKAADLLRVGGREAGSNEGEGQAQGLEYQGDRHGGSHEGTGKCDGKSVSI